MMEGGTFDDFQEASRSILGFLHQRYGFGLWMVTRVQEDDWIILQAEDHHYEVRDGTVLKWADSFCSRMARDEGPRIAARSSDVPAYAEAAIGKQLEIGAYVGVPLRHPDGELFGTMCAIDPAEQPHITEQDLPLIELLGKLLSTILARDLEQAESERQIREARHESLNDPMTGLPNRRAWNQMIEREQSRLHRLGGSAVISIIDLDELKEANDAQGHAAGDELLQRCARAIGQKVRDNDFVARLGGDEFGIASISYQAVEPGSVTERLAEQLAQAGVRASIGGAAWRPGEDLADTWQRADAAMYENKHRHRARDQ